MPATGTRTSSSEISGSASRPWLAGRRSLRLRLRSRPRRRRPPAHRRTGRCRGCGRCHPGSGCRGCGRHPGSARRRDPGCPGCDPGCPGRVPGCPGCDPRGPGRRPLGRRGPACHPGSGCPGRGRHPGSARRRGSAGCAHGRCHGAASAHAGHHRAPHRRHRVCRRSRCPGTPGTHRPLDLIAIRSPAPEVDSASRADDARERRAHGRRPLTPERIRTVRRRSRPPGRSSSSRRSRRAPCRGRPS